MQTRILGDQHLKVSSLGIGCWGMSHAYGKADETESLATLHQCLDEGITFFDTADVYGDGHNETLIRKVLKTRRKEVVLATKFGFTGDEHGNVRINGRPDYVRRACENSLQRLGIDEIDLYYFHRLDPDVPIEETIGTMSDLAAEGKIRFLGLSEVSETTIRKAHTIHTITALQSEYSLWYRDVEKTILPLCKELHISLVPFSPLGRGFLTGTILDPSQLKNGDYRQQIPRFEADALQKNLHFIKRIQDLAEKSGFTASQLALAWLLAKDTSIVPIPGMKRRKYIHDNLAAVDLMLQDDLIHELDHMEINISGNRHNSYNLNYIDS